MSVKLQREVSCRLKQELPTMRVLRCGMTSLMTLSVISGLLVVLSTNWHHSALLSKPRKWQASI